MTKWLIEKEFDKKLEDNILKNNIDHVLLETNFNVSDIVYEHKLRNSPVISYGSIDFIKKLKRHDIYPGDYCTFEKYKYSNYAPYLKEYILNDEYIILTAGSVNNNIINKIFEDSEFFFKPNNGDKKLSGKIYNVYGFISYIVNSIYFNLIEKTDLLVLSKKKEIEKEYRTFIIKDKVITGSFYKGTDFPQKYIDYASEIAKISYDLKLFDNPYTLDICKLKDNSLKLVEVNSFSCSGLYDSDIDVIIEEISKLAEEDFRIELS
jgi:hypothetical protein